MKKNKIKMEEELVITDFTDLLIMAADQNMNVCHYWDFDFSYLNPNYEEVFEFVAERVRDKFKNQNLSDHDVCLRDQDTMKLGYWGWSFWFPRIVKALRENRRQEAKNFVFFAANMYLKRSALQDIKREFPEDVEFHEYVEEEIRSQVHIMGTGKYPRKKLVNGKYVAITTYN